MSEVREDAVEKAERLGLALVIPKPDEVFVDIDSPEDLGDFAKRFKILKKLYPDVEQRVSPSQTAGHYHIIVTISELAPIGDHERIAIQAALGSDPFRELLAIFHGRAGYQYTSVFFEKKAKTDAAGDSGPSVAENPPLLLPMPPAGG